MAQYAKSWTDKYDDEWYIELNLHERGMYDQLSTWAKRQGDTGVIFFRSWSHVGQTFGCDGKTAGKILGKFQENSKVEIIESKKSIRINLRNYEKNQRVKKVTDKKEYGKVPDNSPPIRKDKIREEKNREEAHNNPDVLRIYEKICTSEYIRAIQLEGPYDWIFRLIAKFGIEKVERGLDSLFELTNQRGYRIPTDHNIRPRIWKWIEREREERSLADEFAER